MDTHATHEKMKHEAKVALTIALKEARFALDELIGKRFIFTANHHKMVSQVLMGKIESLQVIDGDIVDLYVNVPYLQDRPLLYLKHDGAGWKAVADREDRQHDVSGELEILWGGQRLC